MFLKISLSRQISIFVCSLLLFLGLVTVCAASGVAKTLVLEEQRVEGKIRRPQLVLIKADQRPAFNAMAIQSFGTGENIADFVDPQVLAFDPYKNAFRFNSKHKLLDLVGTSK